MSSEDEYPLQAVIIADSFNTHFRPLTLHTPRCLLPIANVPLLDYTLETLAVSGVQDVHIVCCAHADQIKSYIAKSRWSNNTPPIVRVHVAPELLSVGDAIREMDGTSLLKSDFILVHGDLVSNINLQEALAVHK